MSAYDNLLDGSFKGVPFFVNSEALDAFGRKVAVQRYPNTSEQFVEDLGGFSPSFHLIIFFVGENTQDQLASFMNAANEGDFGSLVLPFLGEFKVKCGECRVSIAPNRSAEFITVEANFFTSRTDAGFVEDTDTTDSVYENGDLTRESLNDSFSNNYSIPQNDLLSDISARLDALNILNEVSKLKSFISSQDWAKILLKIDVIAGNVGCLVNNAYAFGEQLCGKNGLYQYLSNALIGAGTQNLINTICRISNVHEKTLQTQITAINNQAMTQTENNYWKNNTQTRIERNESRASLSDFHRLNMLTIAYEQYPDITYNAYNDVYITKTNIEDSYISLFHKISPIIIGEKLVSGKPFRSRIVRDTKSILVFEQLRNSSLKAAESYLSVKYKIENKIIPDGKSIGIYKLAYMYGQEYLNDENSLIELATKFRNINDRKIYALDKNVNVLRRI